MVGACGRRLLTPDAVERESPVTFRSNRGTGRTGPGGVADRGRRRFGGSDARSVLTGLADGGVRGPGPVYRVIDVSAGLMAVLGCRVESVIGVRGGMGAGGDPDAQVGSCGPRGVDAACEMSEDQQNEPQEQADMARPPLGPRSAPQAAHTRRVIDRSHIVRHVDGRAGRAQWGSRKPWMPRADRSCPGARWHCVTTGPQDIPLGCSGQGRGPTRTGVNARRPPCRSVPTALDGRGLPGPPAPHGCAGTARRHDAPTRRPR